MRILVLHVPDCPNLGRARDGLRDALAALKVTASVDEIEVATEESAARVGMHGSPTILIDGIDPFSAASAGPSLSCRLFDTPAGVDGAPTVAQLIEAISTTSAPDDPCCGPDTGLLRVGLTEVALALSTAGFAALWNGEAKRPEDLVPGRPDDASVAAAALRDCGRAELDGAGNVIGIHGLTLHQTRHHIVHSERRHFTWCAFDSIGIPAALRLDAAAHTDCPTCRMPLIVDIHHGDPAATSAVLWLPDSAGQNLMAEFCAKADLYCSREHLERRIDTDRTPGKLIDASEAAALGRTTWMDVSHLGGASGP